MVYLVWVKSEGYTCPTLVGVWADEAHAQSQAATLANAMSEGTGRVTQSMMGDQWDAIDKCGQWHRTWIDSHEMGAVPVA